MTHWHWKLAALIAVAAGAGLFAFHHRCYSATLHSNESWLHTQPRFYRELFGEVAPNVRDNVGFVGEAATDVTVLTKNDSLLRRVGLSAFRRACRKHLEDDPQVSKIGKCGPYATEEADWLCLEWRVRHERVDAVQRAYFTKRGISNTIVLFTAVPPARFDFFGAPTGWLDRMEWHGPSIVYSY